ncbi:uncharacterized protein LOC144907125 [Branchiostoma floridae x Branchiostoma belcheri]
MADPVTDLFVLFLVLFLLIVLVLSVTSAVVLIGWMGVKVLWPRRKEIKKDETDEESDWEVENDINDEAAENDTNTIISIVKNIEGTSDVTENKDGVSEDDTAAKAEVENSDQSASINRVTVLQFPVTQTSISQSERPISSKSSDAGSSVEPEVELDYGDLLGPPPTPEVEEEREGGDGKENLSLEEYEEDDLVFEIPEELRFSRYQYLFKRGDFDSSDEDRGYMSSEDELDRWVRRRSDEYRAAPGRDDRHRLTPIPSAENEDVAEEVKEEDIGDGEDGDEHLPFANDIDDEVVTILAAISEWKQNGDKKTQSNTATTTSFSTTKAERDESKSPSTALTESSLGLTEGITDHTGWKSRSPSPRPASGRQQVVFSADQTVSKEKPNKQHDEGSTKIAVAEKPTFGQNETQKPKSPIASFIHISQEIKASGIDKEQSDSIDTQGNLTPGNQPTHRLSPIAQQTFKKDNNKQAMPVIAEPKSLAQHLFEPESSDEDEDDDFLLSYTGRQLSTPTPVFDRKSPETAVNQSPSPSNMRSGTANKLSVDASVGISNFKGPPLTNNEKMKQEKAMLGEQEQRARVSRFKDMLKPAVSVTKEQPKDDVNKEENEEKKFEKFPELAHPIAQPIPIKMDPQPIKEPAIFTAPSNVWRKVEASHPIAEPQSQGGKKGHGHQLTVPGMPLSLARAGEIGRDSSGFSVKKHLGLFEAMSELRQVTSSRPPSPRNNPAGSSRMYRSMPDLVTMWKGLETISKVPKPFPTKAFVPPEWKARKDLGDENCTSSI